VSATPVIICSLASMTPAINLWPVLLTPAINSFHRFSVLAGVGDTADKHSFADISENFRKKFKMIFMGYSGVRGKLIYEKNLQLKISCQTPLNFQFFKTNIKLF
jgi:protein involved in sex pheromone biosynthesis